VASPSNQLVPATKEAINEYPRIKTRRQIAIYAAMIFTAPCVMPLKRAATITRGKWEGVSGPIPPLECAKIGSINSAYGKGGGGSSPPLPHLPLRLRPLCFYPSDSAPFLFPFRLHPPRTGGVVGGGEQFGNVTLPHCSPTPPVW
jgi:hypothetical protein